MPRPQLRTIEIMRTEDADSAVEASMVAYVRAAGRNGATRLEWERAELRSVAFRVASRRVWYRLRCRDVIIPTGARHGNSVAYRLADAAGDTLDECTDDPRG